MRSANNPGAGFELNAIHRMYVSGVPTVEIAERLGMKYDTVRHAISRARRRNPLAWPYMGNRTGLRGDAPPQYKCQACDSEFWVKVVQGNQVELSCPVCLSEESKLRRMTR